MRYLLEISYNGLNYSGWQSQPHGNTIQNKIEEAVKTVLNEPVVLFASGRTDAGVSAIKQVAHFDFDGLLDKSFCGRINTLLPEDIRVNEIMGVANDFHARFSAKRKVYRYYFYVSPKENAFYDKFATHVKYKLDFELMERELKSVVGVHDFSAFCASNTEVEDKVREVYYANLKKDGDLVVFEICGNGFLYNMVRIIVGTLIDIGRGKLTSTMQTIIKSRNRAISGKTLCAKGLVLKDVIYNG